MLISVISPRHGSGQTITAVNVSALLSGFLGGRSVMVDLNRGYQDLEYYLSPAKANKGLDNFICLHRSGMLDGHAFETCVNRITGWMDIMSSNLCSEITLQEAEALIRHISSTYKLCIFDMAGGSHILSREILQQSDGIIAILPQNKTALRQFIDENPYRDYKGKLFIAVNRYLDRFEGIKMVFSMEEIVKNLCQAGYSSGRVFFLEFDPDLKNECDSQSVLNFIMDKGNGNSAYFHSLNNMINVVLKSLGHSPKKEGKTAVGHIMELWSPWKYVLHQRREDNA